MPKKKCYVPGCGSKSGDCVFHNFPTRNDKLFAIWAHRVGNKDLDGLPISATKSRYICDKHFDPVCKSGSAYNKPLKVHALPTLDLPGFKENPNDTSYCLLDRDTFQQGKLLNCAENKEQKWKYYREMGALLDKQSSSGRLINTELSSSGSVDKTLRSSDPDNVCFSSVSDVPSSSKNQCNVTAVKSSAMEVDVVEPLATISHCNKASNRRPYCPIKKYCLRQVTFKSNPLRCNQLDKRISNGEHMVENENWYSHRERHMRQAIQKLKKECRRIQKNCRDLKTKLRESVECAMRFENIPKNLSETAHRFILCQLREYLKKPKGRRFDIEDKLFALMLYKKSPSAYSFWRQIFILPTKRSLIKLLSDVPLHTGINNSLFDMLSSAVASMSECNKYCVLMFDEISLSTGLTYDRKKDHIIGFQELSNSRKDSFADRALVFMIKGIRTRWKQPVAFYFSEGGIKAPNLKCCIVEVIKKVLSIGLIVIATISDNHSCNNKAIKSLLADTNEYCIKHGIEYRDDVFLINGLEIVHIYDPPHLLKCFRNNFLKYNVRFMWLKDMKNYIASWKDIEGFYKYEVSQGSCFRSCPHLNSGHVYRENMKVMKVSSAAQVFSKRVSLGISHWSNEMGDNRSPTADGTCKFLWFMDSLFDSVNGTSKYPVARNLLRCAARGGSIHKQFWQDARRVLNSIAFIKISTEGGRASIVRPPSLFNWIKTLNGFEYIWEKMQKINGFNFLRPRNFNQDPLENFFGSIRSQGGRYTNPNCYSFINSYKTLIINNLTSYHSPSANCEVDRSTGSLASFKSFLTSGKMSGVDGQNDNFMIDSTSNEIINSEPFTFGTPSIYNSNINAYIAGYYAKKLLKKVKACPICQSDLLSDRIGKDKSSWIEHKDYTGYSLQVPGTVFYDLFEKSTEVVVKFLPVLCTEDDVKAKLRTKLQKYVSYLFKFNCSEHDIIEFFYKSFLIFIIHTWIKNVNKRLMGEPIGENVQCPILKKARQKYIKHKKALKAIAKLKTSTT